MTTTAPVHLPTTCSTDGCTNPAEIGLRLIRSGQAFHLCEPDARRSYDALDLD